MADPADPLRERKGEPKMNIVHKIWGRTTETARKMAGRLPRTWRGRLCLVMTVSLLTTMLMAGTAIRVRTATITDGDQTHVLTTMRIDPHAVIAQAGVELEPDDEVTHEMNGASLTIEIARAFDVSVALEGETTYVSVTGGTVAEAVEAAGITLAEGDELNLDPDAEVAEGDEITITRTRYLEYDVVETYAHKVETNYSKSLRIGKVKVTKKGVNGKKLTTYRVKIVDGQVVDTEKVGSTITKKAVTEVRTIGTNGKIPLSQAKEEIALDKKGQPLKYKKLLTGKCTAYSSEEGTVGTITSTGMKAQVGVVAVNPKVIPYGTKLYIVSPDGKYVYGYAIAGDTGGGVMKNVLLADLFMDTIYECNQFGRRTMNVYILE